MSAVTNMAPHLFRAVVADVPFTDAILTMLGKDERENGRRTNRERREEKGKNRERRKREEQCGESYSSLSLALIVSLRRNDSTDCLRVVRMGKSKNRSSIQIHDAVRITHSLGGGEKQQTLAYVSFRIGGLRVIRSRATVCIRRFLRHLD